MFGSVSITINGVTFSHYKRIPFFLKVPKGARCHNVTIKTYLTGNQQPGGPIESMQWTVQLVTLAAFSVHFVHRQPPRQVHRPLISNLGP